MEDLEELKRKEIEENKAEIKELKFIINCVLDIILFLIGITVINHILRLL